MAPNTFSHYASTGALVKMWQQSRANVARQLSCVAQMVLQLQGRLLEVIVHGVSHLRAADVDALRAREPRAWTIDIHKFDETKHTLAAPRAHTFWASNLLRPRRHAPTSAWQVRVHKQICRWQVVVSRRMQFELIVVVPPQILKSTAASSLWSARHAPYPHPNILIGCSTRRGRTPTYQFHGV